MHVYACKSLVALRHKKLDNKVLSLQRRYYNINIICWSFSGKCNGSCPLYWYVHTTSKYMYINVNSELWFYAWLTLTVVISHRYNVAIYLINIQIKSQCINLIQQLLKPKYTQHAAKIIITSYANNQSQRSLLHLLVRKHISAGWNILTAYYQIIN